jgi:hypothetical protein
MNFDLAFSEFANVDVSDLNNISTQELVNSLLDEKDELLDVAAGKETVSSVHTGAVPLGSSGNKEGRFIQPVSLSQFHAGLQDRIPKSTSNSTKWAVTVFKDWRSWRNFLEDTKKDPNWPIPTLQDGEVSSLDYWLARFICEVRRQDNEPYPPGRYHIVWGKIITTIHIL